ncbi:glycosyltransferase, partial [Candidatus Peregrinibacteria bacterium]|nr:glycosyltransferase [Candidatus Peregrinibacteria bacterium]
SIFNFQFSIILVPFPGHFLMPLAWCLSRHPRRRLLFDAFLSLYDTNVRDRRRVPRWHPLACLWYFVDLASCHLADEVLIDTEEHKKYFVKTFFLRPEKVRVIYLASRSDLFFPKPKTYNLKPESWFDILFYGSYIPLHGIEHILHAAALLQDRSPQIRFTIVGSGQEQPAMHALARELHLQNVAFLPFVPLNDLPSLIHSADLCLGIFGTSGKARRVIPHKVYDAVACGVPVITADTPAMRERFSHHEKVTLCEAGNADALAKKILACKASRSQQ